LAPAIIPNTLPDPAPERSDSVESPKTPHLPNEAPPISLIAYQNVSLLAYNSTSGKWSISTLNRTTYMWDEKSVDTTQSGFLKLAIVGNNIATLKSGGQVGMFELRENALMPIEEQSFPENWSEISVLSYKGNNPFILFEKDSRNYGIFQAGDGTQFKVVIAPNMHDIWDADTIFCPFSGDKHSYVFTYTKGTASMYKVSKNCVLELLWNEDWEKDWTQIHIFRNQKSFYLFQYSTVSGETVMSLLKLSTQFRRSLSPVFKETWSTEWTHFVFIPVGTEITALLSYQQGNGEAKMSTMNSSGFQEINSNQWTPEWTHFCVL